MNIHLKYYVPEIRLFKTIKNIYLKNQSSDYNNKNLKLLIRYKHVLFHMRQKVK